MTNTRQHVPSHHPLLFNVGAAVEAPTKKTSYPSINLRLWTEHKARLISQYLLYFVFITRHGAYIDGFAGPQDPAQPESWAAKLVLENKPPWLRKFFLCDKSPKQKKALDELRSSQPLIRDRMIDVKCCDFNIYIDKILTAENISESTATFCLIDQRTFECNWETVEKISRHKSGMKIEIFYFIPTGWLGRSINELNDPDTIMNSWWGNSNWRDLQGMRGIEVAQSFQRRFLNELKYRYAEAWPIYRQHGSKQIMYYMLHATDHHDAPKLMHRAYRSITKRVAPNRQFRNLSLFEDKSG